MQIPEGWTDDLNLPLAWEQLEQIVDFVYLSAEQKLPQNLAVAKIMENFQLSQEDAALGVDRALGGIVRAATDNPQNRPKKEKDPIAWISFNRCLENPEIIAKIYPNLANRKKLAWWKLWKHR